MLKRNHHNTGVTAKRRRQIMREAAGLEECSWCGQEKKRLRDASEMFGESVCGEICDDCVDQESALREAEPGLYRGDSYERE